MTYFTTNVEDNDKAEMYLETRPDYAGLRELGIFGTEIGSTAALTIYLRLPESVLKPIQTRLNDIFPLPEPEPVRLEDVGTKYLRELLDTLNAQIEQDEASKDDQYKTLQQRYEASVKLARTQDIRHIVQDLLDTVARFSPNQYSREEQFNAAAQEFVALATAQQQADAPEFERKPEEIFNDIDAFVSYLRTLPEHTEFDGTSGSTCPLGAFARHVFGDDVSVTYTSLYNFKKYSDHPLNPWQQFVSIATSVYSNHGRQWDQPAKKFGIGTTLAIAEEARKITEPVHEGTVSSILRDAEIIGL